MGISPVLKFVEGQSLTTRQSSALHLGMRLFHSQPKEIIHELMLFELSVFKV